MTLLTIAAASAVRAFDLKASKKKGQDRVAFTQCIEKFFPWECVTIEDDQHRPARQLPSIAANELYDVFRNPLVHSGGMTSKPHLSGVIGKWHRKARISHAFPGTQDAEKRIAELCSAKLSGERLIKIEAFASTVYTHTLYWCTRTMIERFAADPDVRCDIAKTLGIEGDALDG